MKYILKLVCKIVPVSFLIFSSKSVLAAEAFCSRPEFFGTKKSVVLFILASGLMSGLNPCAIAAIFMIVGYLIVMKGEMTKKVVTLGVTFILTLFVLYFLIGFGFYSLIDSLTLSRKHFLIYQILRFTLGAILIFMAAVNFKEFVFPKKGFGFRISQNQIKFFVKLLDRASFPVAVLLAIGVGIFALPCSLSICIGVINLLPQVSLVSKAVYMFLYSFMFIFPMSLLFILLLASSKKLAFWKERQERFDRWLRLISGLALGVMGLVLILWR